MSSSAPVRATKASTPFFTVSTEPTAEHDSTESSKAFSAGPTFWR